MVDGPAEQELRDRLIGAAPIHAPASLRGHVVARAGALDRRAVRIRAAVVTGVVALLVGMVAVLSSRESDVEMMNTAGDPTETTATSQLSTWPTMADLEDWEPDADTILVVADRRLLSIVDGPGTYTWRSGPYRIPDGVGDHGTDVRVTLVGGHGQYDVTDRLLPDRDGMVVAEVVVDVVSVEGPEPVLIIEYFQHRRVLAPPGAAVGTGAWSVTGSSTLEEDHPWILVSVPVLHEGPIDGAPQVFWVWITPEPGYGEPELPLVTGWWDVLYQNVEVVHVVATEPLGELDRWPAPDADDRVEVLRSRVHVRLPLEAAQLVMSAGLSASLGLTDQLGEPAACRRWPEPDPSCPAARPGYVPPVLGQDPDELTRYGSRVPDLVGLEMLDAAARLGAAGYGVTYFTEPSADQPVDHILRTIPEGGASLPDGETVTIVISEGNTVSIPPELIGVALAGAVEWAERFEMELQVIALELPPDHPNDGQVVAVSPNVGEEIERGSVVTVTVGRADAG